MVRSSLSVLTIPPNVFLEVGYHLANAHQFHTLSILLLTCKAHYDFLLPLLYDTVHITSPFTIWNLLFPLLSQYIRASPGPSTLPFCLSPSSSTNTISALYPLKRHFALLSHVRTLVFHSLPMIALTKVIDYLPRTNKAFPNVVFVSLSAKALGGDRGKNLLMEWEGDIKVWCEFLTYHTNVRHVCVRDIQDQSCLCEWYRWAAVYRLIYHVGDMFKNRFDLPTITLHQLNSSYSVPVIAGVAYRLFFSPPTNILSNAPHCHSSPPHRMPFIYSIDMRTTLDTWFDFLYRQARMNWEQTTQGSQRVSLSEVESTGAQKFKLLSVSRFGGTASRLIHAYDVELIQFGSDRYCWRSRTEDERDAIRALDEDWVIWLNKLVAPRLGNKGILFTEKGKADRCVCCHKSD